MTAALALGIGFLAGWTLHAVRMERTILRALQTAGHALNRVSDALDTLIGKITTEEDRRDS